MPQLSDFYPKIFNTSDSCSMDFQSHLYRYLGSWKFGPCTSKHTTVISFDPVCSFLGFSFIICRETRVCFAKPERWFCARSCTIEVTWSFGKLAGHPVPGEIPALGFATGMLANKERSRVPTWMQGVCQSRTSEETTDLFNSARYRELSVF